MNPLPDAVVHNDQGSERASPPPAEESIEDETVRFHLVQMLSRTSSQKLLSCRIRLPWHCPVRHWRLAGCLGDRTTVRGTRTEAEQRGRERISSLPNRSYEITGVICIQVCPPSVVFRTKV